jgi:transketolase
MRNAFCKAMVALAARERYFFLTGDLGFMALEPLREVLGPRFINAGVAEQNMVSVAAGMARAGGKPWVYSIAPFCYARPFEQIRNDICMNHLPVRLVGNGGGYAYGSMGATHHALEDYGVLLTLPGMRAYIPAFDADIEPVVGILSARSEPAYLRLGRSELDDESALPPYAPWRHLQSGGAGLIVAVGPIAGGLWRATRGLAPSQRPALWLVSELGGNSGRNPALIAPPPALLEAIANTSVLAVVEEHVAQGGFAQHLMHYLALAGHPAPPLVHAHARGYPSGRYGSQSWHRQECGLDVPTILEQVAEAEQLGRHARAAVLAAARKPPTGA